MKIFTYGIEPKHMGGIKNRFGEAEYIDVSGQYQDILAMNAEIVLMNTDNTGSDVLEIIKEYAQEVGEDEDRDYFYLNNEELDEMNEQAIG